MSLPSEFAADLRKHFAGEIRLELASRTLYSTDASIYQIQPLGVVIPRSQDDLHAAVELAARYHVPILPRGSGTSLAGQAIGPALIIDCSRWLDHIVDIDVDLRTATVEPGVILQSLNSAAAKWGLQFGPDPASAERATMGGVIANNATGAHSILYGMTADHLVSADAILADGSSAVLGEVALGPRREQERAPRALHKTSRGGPSSSRYAALLNAAWAVREGSADAIITRFPRTWRNSAGYRLNYLLPWSATAPSEWGGNAYPAGLEPDTINLAHLMAGSEGTLAVISRATVKLVPKPANTVLGILSYESIEAACDDVPALLQHHPSAIELVPRLILRLAQGVAAYANQLAWIRGDPAAILVIEFSGASAQNLRAALGRVGREVVVAESASEQTRVWNVRKVGLGILDSRPQSARPVAFIEDCAIPVENLGVFVREIQKLMSSFGAEGGIYAHASAGCLHIRPILDLKSAAGVRALRSIAEQTLELALQLGGAMASEHGDGVARGEWLRRTYGDELIDAMRSVKAAADPEGILNPGKLWDAPPMDTNLRYGPDYHAFPWREGVDFSARGGLATAIEQCNGQGVCRKDVGVMCPSFQATRDEMHSTRGRANLLRALIRFGGQLPAATRTDRNEIRSAAFTALDLCLGCKACKAECPSGVDMAKLKASFQQEYYRRRVRPLRDYIFGYFDLSAGLLASVGGFVRSADASPLVHRMVSRLTGLAPLRPLPKFTNNGARIRGKGEGRPVFFLRDPFNHYVDTGVEQAAFNLLHAAGFDVRIVRAIGAGASLVSKGFLKAARTQARSVLADLEENDPAGSYPLVCIEPSELSTLKNDYPDLVPNASSESMRRAVEARSVEDFLNRDQAFSRLRSVIKDRPLLFHPHCHEKAERHELDANLNPTYAGLSMLRACDYDVQLLDAGCCGMAGTFGYEAEHYALSQKIAQLRLFPAILAASGTPVAATGAACRMQISQGTQAIAEHPLVWAARATGLS